MSNINYLISIDNPLSHWITIKIQVPKEIINTQSLRIQMPSWRPGKYFIQNYASKVRDLKVCQDEKVLAEKISKDCVQISCDTTQDLSIQYQYYANQMDAGSSYLNDDLFYISPISCLMYIQELQNIPCTITLPKYDGNVSTSLKQINRSTFTAQNYYELSDSPIVVSKDILHHNYFADNLPFNIDTYGLDTPLSEKVLNDFKKFTSYQISFWGGFPSDRYVFQVLFLNYRHYHGVEHQNSSMNVFGPFDDLMKRDRYIDFIGLVSHELFHTWNVTRLRGVEISPYDFSKENYLKSGFVAEGFTTYYGDLMLIRSGVINEGEYLEELNKLFKRHFQNGGRAFNSIYNSSIELWLDGYDQNTPSRKVSIYVKGAVIALILDLWIRKCTQSIKSLDDVMRSMWIDFYVKKNGYTVEDVQNTISKVAGKDVTELFQILVFGTEPLERILPEYLELVGCDLVPAEGEFFESRVGVKIMNNRIVNIDEASSFADKLSIGDVIKTINGLEIKTALESKNYESDPTLVITLDRNGVEKEVNLKPDSAFFPFYRIQKKENISPEQEEMFSNWLYG